MVINAQKQPGWTLAPIVELNGAGAGAAVDGLNITASGSNSTLRGLVVNRFLGDGIKISGGSNNLIAGNYIGTNAAGTGAEPNGIKGVYLVSGSNGNLIGGTAPADRNVIAGNTTQGIYIGGGSNLNVVQGNYIGTNAAGDTVIDNGTDAIVVDGSADTTIGGAAPGAGNLIGGSGRHGIYLYGAGATRTQIQGNAIGTDFSKTRTLANVNAGIYIDTGPHDNRIGGISAGEANAIWNSGSDGISTTATAGVNNSFLTNSLFQNAGLAVDLSNNGVTANDAGDGDAGPNGLQNFPVLASAIPSGGNTTIAGSLNSSAGTTFRIEFFSSPTADASGYGEGQTYLGAAMATTDGSGNATFNTTLTGVSVTAGHFVSAAATVDLGGGNYGSTSEFGANVTAAAVTISGTVFEDVNYGGGAGRDRASSSGVVRSGARVELYDNAGTYVDVRNDGRDRQLQFPGPRGRQLHGPGGGQHGDLVARRVGSLAGADVPYERGQRDGGGGDRLRGGPEPVGGGCAQRDRGRGNEHDDRGVHRGDLGDGAVLRTGNFKHGGSFGIDFGFNFDTIVNTNDTGGDPCGSSSPTPTRSGTAAWHSPGAPRGSRARSS